MALEQEGVREFNGKNFKKNRNRPKYINSNNKDGRVGAVLQKSLGKRELFNEVC